LRNNLTSGAAMSNIHELHVLGMLGDIRQRLGFDVEDNSKDSEIDKMTADQLLREWSAFKLGYSDWWIDMKRSFDKLEFDQQSTEGDAVNGKF